MSSGQVQEIALAYNGYAWGGASLTRKHIGGNDWLADYEQGEGSLETDFVIQVADDAAKAAEILALEAMLHPSQILAVARGRRVQVTDAVVTGTSLTTATGGFTEASDLYLPVSVVGKGVAQITAVSVDGKTLTLSVAVGNGTGLTAFVGYEHLRTSAAGDKYDAKVRLAFPDDPNNTGLRWRVHVRATWELSADQARGCDGTYRRWGRVQTTRDDSGFARVTCSGLYTAGGGNDAKANYVAPTGAAAWIASVLTVEGVTSSEIDYKASRYHYDDEKDLCEFSLTYRQLSRSLPSTAAVGVEISLTRTADWKCGLAGERAPAWVLVSWSSPVGSTSTYTDHVALYTGTIKPYLVAEAKARLGGSAAVIFRERGPATVQGPGGNRIGGELLLWMTGINGNVLWWDEGCEYTESEGLVLAKRHDGERATYVGWSNGGEYRANMAVRCRVVGERTPSNWDPRQAAPPFGVSGLSGRWKRLGRRLYENSVEAGREPDGAGGIVTLWDYQWSAAFVFWADGSVEAPRVETGTTRLVSTQAKGV